MSALLLAGVIMGVAALVSGSTVVCHGAQAHPASIPAGPGPEAVPDPVGAGSAEPADGGSAADSDPAGGSAADGDPAGGDGVDGDPAGGDEPRPDTASVPPRAAWAPALGQLPANLGGFAGSYSWALWTGTPDAVLGSANRDTWTNTAESMVKPWLAADRLRRAGAGGPTGRQLADARSAIIDSDDAAAERLYQAGGADAVIERLIARCGLAGTSIGLDGWWSYTTMTAADAARMGRCLVDGRAAGPTWTPWILEQMRSVRGPVGLEPSGGRWGVVDALPAGWVGSVAIKNGWTAKDGFWRVNCLAVTAGWSLGILSRYPDRLGKAHGARLCRDVTAALLTSGVLPPP